MGELSRLSEEDRAAALALLQEVEPAPSVTYRSRFVKCGRAACKCASGAEVHGPYVYAYWSEGGKTRSRYVGKSRPAEVVVPSATAEPTSSPPSAADSSTARPGRRPPPGRASGKRRRR